MIPNLSGCPARQIAAALSQRGEIDVFQTALDRSEALARIPVGEDVDDGAAGEEAGRDELVAPADLIQAAPVDRLHPDPPASAVDELEGRAFEPDPAVGDDRHSRAKI